MKTGVSFILVIVFLISFKQIYPQTVLFPGDYMRLTDIPATNGSAGNNGTINFEFEQSYNLASKELKAMARILGNFVALGTGEAYSIINYDFDIAATSSTLNNVVNALIQYDVSWSGTQAVLGIALNNTMVNIDLRLIDVTENRLIYQKLIHELDMKTHTLKFVNVGLDYNESGSGINSFSAILKRGHSYKLSLRIIASAQKYAIGTSEFILSDYSTGSRSLVLNHLDVKLGLDDSETLQKLAKVDSLQYKLENHYHTYLTGHGVGHNNVEAQTTLSVFEIGSQEIAPPVFLESRLSGASDEPSENVSMPEEYQLRQNHPNPFNPFTKISFALPEQNTVSIKVYDILGQLIKVLLNDIRPPGYHEVSFDAGTLPSGTYIYEIRAGDFFDTKKMMLVK